MKHSAKLPEPDFFATCKTTLEGRNSGGAVSYARFKKKDEKKQLHSVLVTEQSGLCCYCGRRITYSPEETIKNNCHIEHFNPDTALDLDYLNMFVSCGLSDKGFTPTTCGFSKKNNVIDSTLVPSNPFCETQFSYGTNGVVTGLSPEAVEAEAILSLNDDSLVSERSNLLTGIDALIQSHEINEENITDFLEELDHKDTNGHQKNFKQIISRYLKEEFSLV